MRIDRLHLKKLKNTRDLGGFPTKDGKTIKHGKLIRSCKPYKLPSCTISALNDMGVTTLVDFRSERERSDHPVTPWEGVTYYHLPLLCVATSGITSEVSMRLAIKEDSKLIESEFGNADNYMKFIYKKIVFEEQSSELLGKFLRILVEADGAVLWFCNQGKDRTGIASMLVEWLLGVDEELIVKDYARSNVFLRKKHIAQSVGLFIAPARRHFKQILYAMMQAKPQYISETMDEIKKRFGSVEGYCKTQLGITDEDIQTLKDKYLE